MASLLLGMFVGPRLIAWLRFKQHGQSNVREDTPDTHQKKKGTPTMGGALILLCIASGTLLFADLTSRAVWAALLLTLGYGFIGFLDDWLKLSKRNSKGLAGRNKMVLQTVFYLVAIFGFLLHVDGAGRRLHGPRLLIDTQLTLPFVPTRWFNPDLGWFYVFFAWIVVVGTSNAVNLTDGLDGLAIVPTIIAASTFAILCYVAGTATRIADVETVDGVTRLVGVPLWQLPRHPPGARRRGAGRLLRRHRGRRHLLPLVQHLPGLRLHGRHRLARAGRRARRAGGAVQERGGLRHHPRRLLRGDPLA